METNEEIKERLGKLIDKMQKKRESGLSPRLIRIIEEAIEQEERDSIKSENPDKAAKSRDESQATV